MQNGQASKGEGGHLQERQESKRRAIRQSKLGRAVTTARCHEEHVSSPKVWSITRRSLKHIKENHMREKGEEEKKGKEEKKEKWRRGEEGKEEKRRGKSVFITTKLCDVWALIYKAMKCPDYFREERSNDTEVYLKSFTTPVGVHGFSKVNCYTVKVVYDQKKHQVITAYPTKP